MDDELKLERMKALAETDELVAILEDYSHKVTSFREYMWLHDAAMKWNVIYTSVFNNPKRVKIALPPRDLLPPITPGKALTEDEIRGWVSVVAGIRGHARKCLSGPSNEMEMNEDWRYAEAIFVSEVLEGKINFASRISSKSYYRLEKEWIKYIKCLRAYFNWERRFFWDDPKMEKLDYLEACDHLTDMLVNQEIKARPDEFGEPRDYLIANYLSGDEVDKDKPEVKLLIARKAERIWGTTGERDTEKNWSNAEAYVEMFYENICPAVLESDEKKKREHILRVLKAFQFSKAPENGYRVINCFEVALATYFLDALIIEDLWKGSQDQPQPKSHVRSTVKLDGKVAEFEIPEALHNRLEFSEANHEISFRGVMTDKAKNSLLASNKESSMQKAIEELFNQSRLIHRETTL